MGKSRLTVAFDDLVWDDEEPKKASEYFFFHGTASRPGYGKLHPNSPKLTDSQRKTAGIVSSSTARDDGPPVEIGENGYKNLVKQASSVPTDADAAKAVKEWSLVGLSAMPRLNNFLRTGQIEMADPGDEKWVAKRTKEQLEKWASDLEKAHNVELRQPTTVFRAMNTNFLGSDVKVGDTFTDRGFVATTASRNYGSMLGKSLGAIATINLPKGRKVAVVNAHNPKDDDENEWEVVVGKNVTFKVKSIRLDASIPHYELEIVNG